MGKSHKNNTRCETQRRKTNHFSSSFNLITVSDKSEIILKANSSIIENRNNNIDELQDEQRKINLEDTLLFPEKNLPLFISFDNDGNHFFPKIHYTEGKKILQNVVLLSKEQVKEEYVKEISSLIHPDLNQLEKAKKKQKERLEGLSAYTKSVFLNKNDLNEIEEKENEYEYTLN